MKSLFKKVIFILFATVVVLSGITLKESYYVEAEDNYGIHIDTEKYCVKANNVKYTLSHLKQIGTEFNDKVLKDASVIVLMRDSWEEINTSDIRVDSSNLGDMNTPGTFYVRIILPEYSFNVRVIVEDDTPIAIHSISTTVKGGTISDSCTVNYGDNKTIYYKPYDGYKLRSVIVDGHTSKSEENKDCYTFYNITENHIVEVEFVKNQNNKKNDKPNKNTSSINEKKDNQQKDNQQEGNQQKDNTDTPDTKKPTENNNGIKKATEVILLLLDLSTFILFAILIVSDIKLLIWCGASLPWIRKRKK